MNMLTLLFYSCRLQPHILRRGQRQDPVAHVDSVPAPSAVRLQHDVRGGRWRIRGPSATHLPLFPNRRSRDGQVRNIIEVSILNVLYVPEKY